MALKDLGEDASFLLYLLPIIASIVYGAYEWYTIAHESTAMPGLAFLIVSKSPYLYLISISAICVGLIVDVASSLRQHREGILSAHAVRMQILSVIVLIIALAAAVSVANYNVVNGVSVFIAGRYALIFSFSLVCMSILLVPRQILGTARASSYAEILGLLLIVASPVVLYVGLKVRLGFGASAVGGIIIGIFGAVLFLNNSRLFKKKTENVTTFQSSTQKQSAT